MATNREFPECICGSDKYKIVYKGKWIDQKEKLSFSILQCLSCSLLRNFPIPKTATATTEDVMLRLENLELWRSFGQNLIRLIKKYKNKKRLEVLDIGSNIGIFVKLAEENGWEAMGIDLDKKAIKIGHKKFGVDLRCTDIEGAKFNSDSFDVVVLSHTLEHIFEPKRLLGEIRNILKKDGILVIEIPNIEGLPVKLQKIRGEVWYGYSPTQHIWHFTPVTIRRLFEDEGFEILELNTHHPMHYEKTGSFLDIPRDLLLKVSGLLGMADQITLVATLQK